MKTGDIAKGKGKQTEGESKSGFFSRAKNELSDTAKRNAKKTIKKVIKYIMKLIYSLFALVFGKVFIIVLLIVVLFGACVWFITGNESKESSTANSSSVSYSSQSSKDSIKVAAKGGIAYNITPTYVEENETEEELLNRIKEELTNSGINTNKFTNYELKYLGILGKNGLDYSRYTEEELKALIMFSKADISNQSLDLRPTNEMFDENGNYKKVDFENWPEDQIYGSVQVTRTNLKENSCQYLTYIDSETFEKYVSNGNSEAIKHFTVDDNNDLVLAEWVKNSITYKYEGNVPKEKKEADVVTYNMKIVKFAYKEYIKKFTMPFNLLGSLLAITNNVEFCKEIANLAFDSQIVIDVKEETTLYETTLINEYNPRFRKISDLNYTSGVYEEVTQADGTVKTIIVDKDTTYADISKNIEKEKITIDDWKNEPLGVIISDSTSEEEDYTITETTTIETNKFTIGVEKADTWIIKYETDYGNPIEKVDPQQGKSKTYNIEEINTLNEYFNAEDISEDENDSILKYKDSKKIDALIINRLTIGKFDITQITTTINTSEKVYKLGQPVTKKHIYSRDSKGNLEKFLALYSKHIGPNAISEWLYGMLEREADSEHLVNVMKYLFYIYTGQDYGITSEDDLDLVNLNTLGFTSTYNGSAGGYITGEGIGVEIANFARMFINEAGGQGYRLMYCQTNRSKGFNLQPYTGKRYTSSNSKGNELTPEANEDLTFDCSSFVSFIYKSTLFSKLDAWTTSTFGSECVGETQSGNKNPYFYEVGSYSASKNQLQPGDIILKAGNHVMLYVGNNEIAHAGQIRDGDVTGTVRYDSLGYVDRNFNDSIILRVKPSAVQGKEPKTSITWPNGNISNLEDILASGINGGNLTQQEIEYFKRLVLAEAGNEGYEGMLGVAAVVVNRVNSNTHPNTVVDVINQEGNFSTVKKKSGTDPSNIPAADQYGSGAWANANQAVLDALNGVDNVSPCLKGNKALYVITRDWAKERIGESLFNKRIKSKDIYSIRSNSGSNNVFTYNWNLFSK